MQLTLQHLLGRFPGWQIIDMAGGWIAVRANLVGADSGLANVRWGATLEELAKNLQAERRFQKSRSPAVGQ